MPKPIVDLTRAAFERELAKREAAQSAACKAMIVAGYGNLRGSEIRERAPTEPNLIFADWVRTQDSLQEAYDEAHARKRYHGSMNRIIRKSI